MEERNFNLWFYEKAKDLIEKFVENKGLEKEWFDFVDLEWQQYQTRLEEEIWGE